MYKLINLNYKNINNYFNNINNHLPSILNLIIKDKLCYLNKNHISYQIKKSIINQIESINIILYIIKNLFQAKKVNYLNYIVCIQNIINYFRNLYIYNIIIKMHLLA